jgi:hypothetical protein
MTEPSKDSEAEAKKIKEILATAIETEDSLDALFIKTIRIHAWKARFLHNCKIPKHLQILGPLTTEETEQQL